jgi:leader peptidase (prepilin peptidase)/N-methyltransferase
MTFASNALVLAGTVAAAITDLRSGLIPDRLSATLLALVLIVAAGSGVVLPALAGALAAAGLLIALYLLSGRRGIGLGDVKLAPAIGAGLGVVHGLEALGLAFCGGAVFGLVLLLAGRATRRTQLPFAPFLALGTAVTCAVGFP